MIPCFLKSFDFDTQSYKFRLLTKTIRGDIGDLKNTIKDLDLSDIYTTLYLMQNTHYFKVHIVYSTKLTK